MSGIELFKLQTSDGNGSASSGQVRIFEGREAFENALLLAVISAAAEGDRAGAYVARRWRDVLRRRAGHEDVKPSDRRTLRVVGAWELADGAWVALKWTLREPRVEWRRAP